MNLSEHDLENNYTMKSFTLSSGRAQIQGALCSLPMVILAGTMFRLYLQDRAVLLDVAGTGFFLIMAGITILSAVLHELLHALGWRNYRGQKNKAISIRIHGLMPMCACGTDPLSASAYLKGVLMPFAILGGVSTLFLFICPGTVSLMCVLVNFVLAGADIMIAYRVLKSDADLIIDAPKEAGFYGLYRKASV